MLIGREAARGEDDAVLGVDIGEALLVLDANARDGARLFVGEKRNALRVEAHFDAEALGLGHQVLGELTAARLHFTENEVGAGEHRPDELGGLRELDADVVGEPAHHGVAVFGDLAGESLVALTLRYLHHVFVEGVDAVGVVHALLLGGVHAEHEARGVDRVARGHRHLFNEQRLQAVLRGAHGADETAAARPHDDEVVLRGRGRGGDRRLGGGGDAEGADGRLLEEGTTGSGVHGFSPYIFAKSL